MAYFRSIIQHLEIDFSIYIEEHLQTNIRIENVQYLIPGTVASVVLHPFTLYVGNYQEFSALNNDAALLFYGVPVGLSPSADTAYIHHPINPQRLINSIQNALYKSHQAAIRKEEMFHILQAGYGVQAILDSAHSSLNNPLTMCTTSFSMIAVSPKKDKHCSFEEIDGTYYIRKQFLENMRQKKIIEQLYHSSSPIIASFEHDIGTDYVFCSIRISRAAVGYLCLRCSTRTYTDEDLLFLVDVAKMLSIEMQKDNFYTNQTGIAYEYFLRDLLEQNITSEEFARHRMEQLARPAYQYFWVVVFTFLDGSAHKLNSQYFVDQLVGIFRNSISFAFKGKLVLLLTSNDIDPFHNINQTKFQNFLNLNELHSAISYRYTQILDTHLYYHQALFLLKKAAAEDSACIAYQAFYQNHLFSLVSDQMLLRTMIHPDLLRLREHDLRYHTDYLATLKAYFLNNRNALAASNYLHIHKSTFFYRIGKIQTISGLDLESHTLLFAYEFSLYLLDYLMKSSS